METIHALRPPKRSLLASRRVVDNGWTRTGEAGHPIINVTTKSLLCGTATRLCQLRLYTRIPVPPPPPALKPKKPNNMGTAVEQI